MSINSNLIKVTSNPISVQYGTTAPTAPATIVGSIFYVTPLGTEADAANATEQYVWNGTSWIKTPGGETSAAPEIPAAIAIGTQAQLDALSKNVDEKYIVTDGANKGDILVWRDLDGDGIGETWEVFEVPTNQQQYSVLTNKTGVSAGVYQYDIATDTWTKGADIEPLIPDVEDNTAVGGIKFPRQRLSFNANSGPIFIMYDQVAGFGANASGASAMGTTSVPNGALPNTLRKSPYTIYELQTPFAQVIDYRPFAVDVCQNNLGAAMIDHRGNLFIVGNTAFTQYGLNLTASTTSVAWSPNKFWANHTRKLISVSIAQQHTTLMVCDNEGGLWIVSNAGTTGIYGDGTVATNTSWHKVNVPEQGWKKYQIDNSGNFAMALSNSGDLYAWGTNTGNRINTNATTSIISTPVLVQSSVKDFDFDQNSVMVIKNDGTRVAVGTNTNGKFGNGVTTALNTYTVVPSNGFTFDKVFKNFGQNAYFYITSDKQLVMTGYQDLDSGIIGATAAGNILTPTVCGAGAYQGLVIDVHPHEDTTVLQTNQGEVWSCTKTDSYGETGIGIRTFGGVNIGFNVFKKVPVPSKVIKMFSTSETGSTANIPTFAVLTEEGRVYSWSGWYGDYSNSNNYKYAPYEIPTQQFRQGNPVESTVVDLFGTKLGNFTGGSIIKITDIVDGVNNQSITFTVSYTGGSIGTIDLTGSTVTGADITFVSLTTTRVAVTGSTGTFNVTMVIDAADITALVPPNTQPQNYTLNLKINGI